MDELSARSSTREAASAGEPADGLARQVAEMEAAYARLRPLVERELAALGGAEVEA